MALLDAAGEHTPCRARLFGPFLQHLLPWHTVVDVLAAACCLRIPCKAQLLQGNGKIDVSEDFSLLQLVIRGS